MTDYLRLEIGDDSPDIVTTVIEIPRDITNKYECDKKRHVFKLDRTFYSPVHYPIDYGFIPQTLAENDDPLDILVLGEHPTFPGCVYDAQPTGLFRMIVRAYLTKRSWPSPPEIPVSMGPRNIPRFGRTSSRRWNISSPSIRSSRARKRAYRDGAMRPSRKR